MVSKRQPKKSTNKSQARAPPSYMYGGDSWVRGRRPRKNTREHAVFRTIEDIKSIAEKLDIEGTRFNYAQASSIMSDFARQSEEYFPAEELKEFIRANHNTVEAGIASSILCKYYDNLLKSDNVTKRESLSTPVRKTEDLTPLDEVLFVKPNTRKPRASNSPTLLEEMADAYRIADQERFGFMFYSGNILTDRHSDQAYGASLHEARDFRGNAGKRANARKVYNAFDDSFEEANCFDEVKNARGNSFKKAKNIGKIVTPSDYSFEEASDIRKVIFPSGRSLRKAKKIDVIERANDHSCEEASTVNLIYNPRDNSLENAHTIQLVVDATGKSCAQAREIMEVRNPSGNSLALVTGIGAAYNPAGNSLRGAAQVGIARNPCQSALEDAEVGSVINPLGESLTDAAIKKVDRIPYRTKAMRGARISNLGNRLSLALFRYR